MTSIYNQTKFNSLTVTIIVYVAFFEMGIRIVSRKKSNNYYNLKTQKIHNLLSKQITGTYGKIL